jgi:hypothetical protein
MHNLIILSSGLLGSFFIFSTTLTCINKIVIDKNKVPLGLKILNGSIIFLSGSMILSCYYFGYKALKNLNKS